MSESLEGAKEFLLEEYRSLYTLHQQAKEAGEARLNFFVTFVAGVSAAVVTLQSFILEEARPLLIGGIALILVIVGLITFRKMLQRRVATVIYRRRLGRIRAWFVKHYPQVAGGLPYDISQNVRMDWGAKGRLGSTAFSVAFINTALITLSVLGVGLMYFGLDSLTWLVPVGTLSGALSWYLHILWKSQWMKKAERRDLDDLRALENLIPLKTKQNK
jgi:hypothetical protein